MSHSVIRWPEIGLSHEKDSDFISGVERSKVTETFQLSLCFVFKVGILTRYLGHLATLRHGSICNLPALSTHRTDLSRTLRGSLLSWRPESSALPTKLESLLSSSWPLVFGKIQFSSVRSRSRVWLFVTPWIARSHEDMVANLQPVFELLNALSVRSWDTAEAPCLDGCAPHS